MTFVKSLIRLAVMFAFIGIMIILVCGTLIGVAHGSFFFGSLPTPTATPTLTPTATMMATLSPTATLTPSATSTPTITPSPTPLLLGCADQQGTLVDMQFYSHLSEVNVPYRVYLPPCYAQTARRYPFVILMHGSGADETEWTDQVHLQQALDAGLPTQDLAPMIVIMPGGGENADTNQFTVSSWENVVLNELIPDVTHNFCTWNSREARAIGGISRGGFWAYEIGLRHPDLFGAIGGHSAYFDPENAPPETNPLNLAQTVTFTAGTAPRLWLDVATNDYARLGLETIDQTLTQRGIAHLYTVYPNGEHDAAYWSSHVVEYLQFYGAYWPHRVEDLPSCLH